MTENIETTETTAQAERESKGKRKLIMTKKGAVLWEGKGMYYRVWTKMRTLNDDIQVPVHYFKDENG